MSDVPVSAFWAVALYFAVPNAARAAESNRRAKFYSLTRLGRRHLEREADNWKRLSAAISHVIKLEEA